MQEIQGYYDGTAIKALEKIPAKRNQRVIIQIIDEFIEPSEVLHRENMRGILQKYANPVLAERENDAWARAAVEKHGDT